MIYFAFLACGLTLGIIIGGLNAEKKAIPFADTLRFVLSAVLAGVARLHCVPNSASLTVS